MVWYLLAIVVGVCFVDAMLVAMPYWGMGADYYPSRWHDWLYLPRAFLANLAIIPLFGWEWLLPACGVTLVAAFATRKIFVQRIYGWRLIAVASTAVLVAVLTGLLYGWNLALDGVTKPVL